MRFATSSLAVAVGLVLAVILFGQPRLYVVQAHQHWDALFRTPNATPAGTDRSVVSDKLQSEIQLQQEVKRLRDQLAATQSAAEQARQQLVAMRQQQLDQQAAEQRSQQQAEQQRAQQQMVEQQRAQQLADQQRQQQQAEQQRLQQAAEQQRAQQQAAEQQRAQQQQAEQLRLQQQAEQQRAEQQAQAAAAATADRNASRIIALTGGERRDAPKPPPAAAPPKPRPDAVPAPRSDPDNAQSVLARLRQQPYVGPAPAENSGQPPVQVAGPPQVTTAQPASRPPSVSRQRLELARTALINGRIEEARRLLQEVQLQLVFRPVNPSDDDAAPSGQGASDVARALGSLSGNDTAQSQRYIERALETMAGGTPRRAETAIEPMPGGYAPAYPSR